MLRGGLKQLWAGRPLLMTAVVSGCAQHRGLTEAGMGHYELIL